MTAYLNKILNDDFIWSAITLHLDSQGRSNTDYLKYNCPMCVHNGETADKKKRGGVRRSTEGIGINCFNCGFKTRYRAGQPLTRRMKHFLMEIGCSEYDVDKLSFKAFQIARVVTDSKIDVEARIEERFVPRFNKVDLPPDTKPIIEWAQSGDYDENLVAVVDYAISRAIRVEDMLWSKDRDWNRRLLIPFHYKGEIVGYTGRAIDGGATKYMSNHATDFIYNADILRDYSTKYALMPEGVLDAYAINGISPLGAKLSSRQINWLADSGKTIILIPDPDSSGSRLVDAALKNNWMVAFPKLVRGGNNWWDTDVKDCAKAVERYGKLYTIRSILATATSNKLEINVKTKWLYEKSQDGKEKQAKEA